VARPDPKPENDTGSLAQAKSGFNLDNMIARLVEKDAAGDAPPAVVPDRELVLAVQLQLARIGFDPGPPDGQVGARTVQAIEAYQGARGLPVDGRPSRELLDRLAPESSGATGADQTSRIATNHAVAQLLGAADGEKLSRAGADANEAAPPAPPPAAPTKAAAWTPILDGYDAFEKAFVASEAGDFARAIALYGRAIEGGDLELTYLADAFYNRANVRSHTKEYDFAIADYGAAIVNKPEFPGAYHNRGFAFEASGRHNRAMADFIKARALGMGRLPARTPDQPPPLR
jgi:peptidoglycan hydrolase-like protein with peptidoglycan-binding domain